MNEAIQADAIVRRFGEVDAIKGINLSVKSGEIYGFLGPNGAGKSTAVRILTTLLLPSSGSVVIQGLDAIKEPQRVKLVIGAALQELSLDPKQTGRELLTLQGRLYGLSRKDIKRRIDELIPLIDIGDALDRLTVTYSGGMKRRLDLAASMIHEPEVLFLDEPTTGLDPASRQKIWDQVRSINRDSGVTVFLTTQYLEEADVLAERISIIDEGVIVVEGTPEQLKHSVGADIIVVHIKAEDAAKAQSVAAAIEGVENVENYTDEIAISVSDGSTMIGKVALALNAAGVGMDQILLRTPTLDDVFLKYTGARLDARQEQQSTEEAAAA